MTRLTKDQRLSVKNSTLMALAFVPSQAVFDACKFRTLRMFAKLSRTLPNTQKEGT